MKTKRAGFRFSSTREHDDPEDLAYSYCVQTFHFHHTSQIAIPLFQTLDAGQFIGLCYPPEE